MIKMKRIGATAFLVIVVLLVIVAAAWTSHNTPKCSYSFDLQTKILKSSCPVNAAALYDVVIVTDKKTGIKYTMPEKIGDIQLQLITSSSNLYVYRMYLPDVKYDDNAYVVVDFVQKR